MITITSIITVQSYYEEVGLLVAVALALALLNGLRAFAFHMARVRCSGSKQIFSCFLCRS